MKIITILGARPQFIKAGSVSREIVKQKNKGVDIQEIIVHTGQHYDANMSDIFFEEMQIPKPRYFLGIGGKTHGAMTGQMIENIEEILLSEQPDTVMVYGDTNSTLAGAIAASKLHIAIAHVEAGLRSFNMRMPEEINRILTDRISSWLFCPTQQAVRNLTNEGFAQLDAKVLLSGDVMQDSALFYAGLAQKPPGIPVFDNFILCTLHRAENTDDAQRLSNIILALNEISEETSIILPLHPRTKQKLENISVQLSKNIFVIEPVGFLNMIWLLKQCRMVMTDSGGLQKEAFFFAKPCITLRDETEWVELVENGFNQLVGADRQNIIKVYQQGQFSVAFSTELFGGGKASENIVNELMR